MLNPPDGQELLIFARREELKLAASGDPGKSRYLNLLIKRAREIAERDAARSAAAGRQELTLLNAVYGTDVDVGETQALHHRLYILNARLAADLRARRLDRAQQAAVLELLGAQVRARLAITNPKYLDTADCHE